MTLHQIPWVVGFIACAIAAWTDIRSRRVPNWLTLPLIAAAPVFALFNGWAAFGAAWIVLVLAFLAGTQLHGLKLFGGGDVKLFVGIATLCGYPACVNMALYTALAGGVMAICIALARRDAAVLASVFSHFKYSIATGRLETEITAKSSARMPYAIAIFFGFSIAVLADGIVPFLRILR